MKNLSEIKVSVLDLAPIIEGRPISESFHNSLELARHVEALGYQRYWLAEHHNLEGIASAATSVLIGYIAAGTKSIRVGSGGVMLPNHAPLVIAEQFGTLETLYPNRIDLGLGRAPGTDRNTMRALRREMSNLEAEFSDQVQELQEYLAPAEPGQKVKAIPGAGLDIPIWLLGSSLYSAQWAALLGLPYAFAGHFAPEMMMQAIDVYRSMYQPSDKWPKPYLMIGVQVIAAETSDKAQFLATSVYQRFLGIIKNQRMHLKPPTDMEKIWSPAEKEMILAKLSTSVIGDREAVRAGLQVLAESTGADEFMIVSDTYSFEDRKKSFELIQEAVRGK